MASPDSKKAFFIGAAVFFVVGLAVGGFLGTRFFFSVSSPAGLPLSALLEQAHRLLDEGRLADAERAYQNIFAQDAANPEALSHLGNVAFQRGEVERALGFYEEALRRDPLYGHALWDRGIALQTKGDDAGAIAAWEAFARLFPAESSDVVQVKKWISKAKARLGSTSAVSPGPVPLSPLLFAGQAARAYQAAREIPDILQQLRCYCGCDKPPFNHTSLLSCYLDNHAAT